MLERLLPNLTGQQKEVITKRYGLYLDQGLSILRMASELNLRKERIRNIEGLAIRKLRSLIHNPETFI